MNSVFSVLNTEQQPGNIQNKMTPPIARHPPPPATHKKTQKPKGFIIMNQHAKITERQQANNNIIIYKIKILECKHDCSKCFIIATVPNSVLHLTYTYKFLSPPIHSLVQKMPSSYV